MEMIDSRFGRRSVFKMIFRISGLKDCEVITDCDC